jgi:TIR domain
MGQKFFISFNSADRTKAHWIAWTLKEAGHEVAVHDWEIPAGGNVPLWMSTKLAWADRLIAVISPDYVPSRIRRWNGLPRFGTKILSMLGQSKSRPSSVSVSMMECHVG